MQTARDTLGNAPGAAVGERKSRAKKSSGDILYSLAGGEHCGVIMRNASVTFIDVYGPRRATIEPLIAERRRSLEEQED